MDGAKAIQERRPWITIPGASQLLLTLSQALARGDGYDVRAAGKVLAVRDELEDIERERRERVAV